MAGNSPAPVAVVDNPKRDDAGLIARPPALSTVTDKQLDSKPIVGFRYGSGAEQWGFRGKWESCV